MILLSIKWYSINITVFLYLYYILSFNQSPFPNPLSSFNVYLLLGGQNTYICIYNSNTYAFKSKYREINTISTSQST